MNPILASQNFGITVLIVLLVVVFFQVIIHNAQESKRYKRMEERLNQLEDKIGKLISKNQ